MLFIPWWLVWRLCLGFLAIAAAIFALRRIRGSASSYRRLLRRLSRPLALAGGVFILLNLLIAGCQDYSPPVYSPDGKIAARLRSADEGILGESTTVELYTAHGFASGVVFRGPWESVDPSAIRWTSNSYLEIPFTDNVFYCGHAFHVSVHCIRR